jgi:hypothetical protein
MADLTELFLKNYNKTTVEHFSNLPTVLFSEKSKLKLNK